MESRVLIAPLNWGLGHATRCIPIIQSYLDKGSEIVIASDGDALNLLKMEFPDLSFYEISGYKISYPYNNILANVLLRSFSILKAIWSENKRLKAIVSIESPQIIVSDNRYGIFHKDIKSIFMGHQIHLKTGNRFLSRIASWINHKMISRFDEIWIPDFEGESSLAGDLSRRLPFLECKYLGPLSRFKKERLDIEYDICAVISGPEPQREKIAKLIIDQLNKLEENSVIVLGDLQDDRDEMLFPNSRAIGHLKAKELNDLINQSKIVIARSGYSTIMDLYALQKPAILIPTPGQSEQMYLSKHLQHNKQFVFQSQQKLNIPLALEELARRKDY